MIPLRKTAALLVCIVLCLGILAGCVGGSLPTSATTTTAEKLPGELRVTNADRLTLAVRDRFRLVTNLDETYGHRLTWEVTGGAVSVDGDGIVTALREGTAAVTVRLDHLYDTVLVTVIPEGEEPPPPATPPEGFAASYEEAIRRSERGEVSGFTDLPDQEPVAADYQPTVDGMLVRNCEPYYLDENTWVVVDACGDEVYRIYRGGGYIGLEEVAAYVYAFGDVPANYVSSKSTSPTSSKWGIYLRLNHTAFSGNTSRYPYEPELPRISGCGGDLRYYEIDIGTTGTDCDPSYAAQPYNDGRRITRGAARIVYARFDANGDRVIDLSERFVFYTYNHYNDFQEYLGYFGGWGEMFGNITGGGTISSKYDCNPTDYVPTYLAEDFSELPVPVLYVFWREE